MEQYLKLKTVTEEMIQFANKMFIEGLVPYFFNKKHWLFNNIYYGYIGCNKYRVNTTKHILYKFNYEFENCYWFEITPVIFLNDLKDHWKELKKLKKTKEHEHRLLKKVIKCLENEPKAS